MNKYIDKDELKQTTIAAITQTSPKTLAIQNNVNFFEIREEDFNRQDNEPSLYEEGIKIIDAIIETALDSKIHGVSNMIRVKSKLLKLIWFFCFLLCAGYCIYQIVVTVIVFIEFKAIPSTKIKFEAPTYFPAVDICNLDAYDGNTARDDLDSILAQYNVTSNGYQTVKEYVDRASFVFKSGFEKLASNGSFSLYDNGFYLNQMLISCQYQGNPCGLSDFFYYHDYNYGSCFSFNLGKVNNATQGAYQTRDILKSQKAGWENGLQLELFVGNSEKQQQYNFKAGVRVIVHNQSITPFPNDEGIDIGTGQQTNIAVSRNFFRYLSKPYSDCIDAEKKNINWNQNDVFIFIKKYYFEKFELYFQKFCLKACLQKYIIEKCKCFDPQFPTNETVENGCFSLSEIDCVTEKTANFYASSEAIQCYSKCPLECESVIYDIESTIASYPTEWYSNLLLRNKAFSNLVINNTVNYTMPPPTNESLSETILMLNVFYNELFYTETEEEPKMSIDLLISYTGGNFSLFLGISLLTLAELLEIVFQIIYLSIKQQFQNRKETKKQKNFAKDNMKS